MGGEIGDNGIYTFLLREMGLRPRGGEDGGGNASYCTLQGGAFREKWGSGGGFPPALPFILCTQESQELGHMCMNSMGI